MVGMTDGPQTTLLLTRHGQTEWNLQRKLQGRLDAPLTLLGLGQASALADALAERALDFAYVSPTDRTRETARIALEGHGLEPVELEDLREMDLGCWQGHCLDDIPHLWPHQHQLFWNQPEAYTPPDEQGESFADLKERATRLLDFMLDRHRGQSVLLVTHSLVIKAFWLVAANRPISAMWEKEEIAGGSLTELAHDGGAWSVVRLGEVVNPARSHG